MNNNLLKKATKRTGRALGFSETYDRLAELDKQISETNEHIDHLQSYLGQTIEDMRKINNLAHQNHSHISFSLPFLQFYYYNECAKRIHPLLFEQYRDCNHGQNLVIVACGPSVDKYKPLSGAKHLAINRAFFREDIKFDYLFMHDNMLITDHRKELKEYAADKFAAFATSSLNAKNFNIPSKDITDIGARRFLISDPAISDLDGGQFDVIQPDITKGMLYDRGGGTVFSALQFALFTSPKTIYLVGCDCTSNGYFGKIPKGKNQNLLDKTEYLWREAKIFLEQYYPKTRIVSINPVKLRGLFEDIDQE